MFFPEQSGRRQNFPTLKDLKTKTFDTLVMENKILYLDSYQIENEVIAMTPEEMKSKDRAEIFVLRTMDGVQTQYERPDVDVWQLGPILWENIPRDNTFLHVC